MDSLSVECAESDLLRDYEVYAAAKAGVKTARREHQWTRLDQKERDAFQKAADKHCQAHMDNAAVRAPPPGVGGPSCCATRLPAGRRRARSWPCRPLALFFVEQLWFVLCRR